MEYRKEIDGLRTTAVIPVIFFHAGLLGFGGGYVGVDIFFVISGYLITSIIIDEYVKSDSFSIINFYERRARRILPALSVVLLFTTVAAIILMPVNLLKSYSQSLVSVASFSSNIFFYLTNNYFSTASDEKPLLHTWSLAVEEQYYLFFPLLISCLWAFGKKTLISLIAALTLISLFFAQYMSSFGSENANFYLIFSRAWELFAGSLLALIGIGSIKKYVGIKNIMCMAGLALILYSIFFFDGNTPFPSIYTAIPVLGTALVIVFCDNNTIVGKLLSSKVFVSIGLISYPLYLWHQPLFAFLRLKTAGEPKLSLFGLAIVLAFLMAYLSYQFVEKPFRNRAIFSNVQIIAFSIVSISVFLGVGLLGHYYNGFPARFDNVYVETIRPSPRRDSCHTEGIDYVKPENACRYGGKNITWASFGDSHTVEPAYALSKLIDSKSEGLVHLSFSACPPALLFEAKKPGCSDWIKESLLFLEGEEDIQNVLLGFRYSAFLFGDQLDFYPGMPNINPANEMLEVPDLDAVAARELYWRSLNEIIDRLHRSGKNIYILYPIPELPIHISIAVTPFSIFGGKLPFDLSKITTFNYYENRNEYILKKLDTLNYDDRLHAIKPLNILCESLFCPAVSEGKALYFDDDHLSIYGADMLLRGSQIAEQY